MRLKKPGRKSLIAIILGALAGVGIVHKRRTANDQPGVPQTIAAKSQQLGRRVPRPTRLAVLRRNRAGDPGAVEFDDRHDGTAGTSSES